MSRLQYSVDVSRPNGIPFIVKITPSYTRLDERLGRVPSESQMLVSIYRVLRNEIHAAVSGYTGWGPGQINQRIVGYLSAESSISGKDFTTDLRLRSFRQSDIEYAIENIQQSNSDVNIYELEWSYQIDPNSLRVGGKAPEILPGWVPRKRFIETWKNHEWKGKKINCAAYAINYLVNHEIKRYRSRYTQSCKDAYILQQRMCWGDIVTFEDIKNIVQVWKNKRVVLLDGSSVSRKMEFSGDYYSYNGKQEILYLFHYQDFKSGECHYAACESTNKMLKSKVHIWCHYCQYSVDKRREHLCEGNIEKYIVKSKPCKECGIIGKHKCPLVTCSICRDTFNRSEKYHRCPIILGDKSGEKSWFMGDGREETEDDNGKYPAILVYDVESVFERISSMQTVIVKHRMDSDYIYAQDTSNVVEYDNYYDKHEVNLVIVVNMFTKQEWSFFGDNSLRDFILFSLRYNGGNNILWAHNGSGYDTRLVFEEVVKMSVDPRDISQIVSGSRFMQFKLGKTKFRDSLRHLPGSLKNLGREFCKGMLKKGDFPFMFNKRENYDYVGKIPGLEYYPMDKFRSESEMREFMEYYESWNGKTNWSFKEQLVDYCRNDVLMLCDILYKYHKICFQFAEISPLCFVTGPGFVHNFCDKDSWRQLTRDDPCPTEECDKYEWTQRIAKEKYWAVLTPYEDSFARKALKGGRTENKAFYYNVKDDEKIGYIDVVSMYPSVQIDCEFPVGVPEIFIWDWKYWPCKFHCYTCECDCGEYKKNYFYKGSEVVKCEGTGIEYFERDDFFGIVCATVIPPKDIPHPYYLSKKGDKNVGTLLDEDHVEIVVTSVELNEMIRLYGYEFVRIHCFHRYRRGNYWKEPTLQLYLEKMLNSRAAPESEYEKNEFLKPWIEKYGEPFGDDIRNSWPRWGKNPALKQVAKIMMNSVWGKQAQRSNMPQSFLFSFNKNRKEIEEYYLNCQSEVREHNRTVQLGDGIIMNTCTDFKAPPYLHEQYMPSACFVTAHSRSKLYKEIWSLGKRVLYMDTDSIIYRFNCGDGEYEPPQGNMVGEWETDDMINKHGEIVEFISMAPKTYGLRFRDGEKIVKAKGISLSRATERQFNYDIMKNHILDWLGGDGINTIKVSQSGIAWNYKQGMKSVFTLKDVRIQPTHFKGELRDDGFIYPFGFQSGDS